MTTRFLFAIAAERQVGLVRQGGQEVEIATGGWRVHLGLEPPSEGLPGPFVPGIRGLEQGLARREVGKPDVIDVPAGYSALGTPRGGRRTAPMRRPSASGRGLPSLTMRMVISPPSTTMKGRPRDLGAPHRRRQVVDRRPGTALDSGRPGVARGLGLGMVARTLHHRQGQLAAPARPTAVIESHVGRAQVLELEIGQGHAEAVAAVHLDALGQPVRIAQKRRRCRGLSGDHASRGWPGPGPA